MRILIVSHGVIGNDSGVGRVHYEIMKEYRKAGHHVDKVDYADLYPNGQGHFGKIFDVSITRKILAYLQANAWKYDVIEANAECVVYPKEKFGFKGLLFVRSHGARPLGEAAKDRKSIKEAFKKEKKERKLRTVLGLTIRYFHKKMSVKGYFLSIQYADIVHCLNKAELRYLLSIGVSRERIICLPNALPSHILGSLEMKNKKRKYNSSIISFVAAWRIFKGIKDWREISASLLRTDSIRKIVLLGTTWPEDLVRNDFDIGLQSLLQVVTSFKPAELPQLLYPVKVGIFTSYTEGFGFAVVEQLASGIPTVAYDISGVQDILQELSDLLLVEPGNVPMLVEKAKYILEMEAEEYEELSLKCIKISKKYTLEDIAPLYLQKFEEYYYKNGQL